MSAPLQLDPNPAQARAGWPPVVVGSAFQTGVLLARNLERRGVRVYLVDSDPSMHGFRSIYGTTLRCPNPDSEPAAWLKFMLELGDRAGGRPVLIAASDQFVSAFGAHEQALAAKFRLAASASMQAALALKEGQVRLALQHGLPIPRTRYANSEADVAEFAAAGGAISRSGNRQARGNSVPERPYICRLSASDGLRSDILQRVKAVGLMLDCREL